MKGRKREKKERVRAGMPDAFVLREGAAVARGAVSEGGVPLLVYQIALPAFREDVGGEPPPLRGENHASATKASPRPTKERGARARARMADFYARIAEEIWRACEGTLFPFVRGQYEESDDPQKRFRFARYILTADFTLSHEGGNVTVLRRAVLSRRGKVLYQKEWRECFSEKSGRVLMPRFSQFLSRMKPKKGLKETLKIAVSRHTDAG